MVSLKEMIDGAWIEGEMLTEPGDNFVGQLADLLAELHQSSYASSKSNMGDCIQDLVEWKEKDTFCEDALYDLYAIKSKLSRTYVCLHGDLWKQNILVDEEGNLNGLRDWEALSYGDPHWDFRMIRRWIGWEGLDKLLYSYNCQVDWHVHRTYVEILDRISICHSIRIRKERGLLRHDKPDAIENFENMKRVWKNRPYPDWG